MYASFMSDTLGPVPLHALDAATVRTWFASLDTTAHRKFKTYGRLHSIVATAVSDGLLSPNPCDLVVKKPPRKVKPAELTPSEVAQLAKNIEPQQFAAFVLIGGWCGLRLGELIGLQRADISDDAAIITVARQIDHEGGCRVDTVKQGEEHTVVVPRRAENHWARECSRARSEALRRNDDGAHRRYPRRKHAPARSRECVSVARVSERREWPRRSDRRRAVRARRSHRVVSSSFHPWRLSDARTPTVE